MNNIRIGVVGMGEHIRRAHIPGLLQIEGVKIVRWFDPALDEESLSKEFVELGLLKEDKGVKSTFEEIINDEEINVVLIGSPDTFHPDQFLASVEAGKHVFVEKPLAVDSIGFAQIIRGLEIAKEKSLVISSCHPRRFDPPVVALKKMLDDEVWVKENLGQIRLFDFRFLYHQVTDAWKQDRSLMLDHFGHEIDLVRYMFNKINQEVSITAQKIRDGFAAYTVEGAIDDIKFIFDGKRILDDKKYQEYIEIRGSLGFITLYINAGIAILNSSKNHEGKSQSIINLPPKDYVDMFKFVNENFVASIRGEQKPYLEYYDFLVNNYSGIMLLEQETFSTETDLKKFSNLLN
jgi:predicted dehydrogenase